MKLKRSDYSNIALLVSFFLLGIYLADGSFDSYEIVYVHDLQHWVITNHLTLLFEALTYAGDLYVWFIILGLFLIIERKNPRRAFKMVIFMAIISAVDFIVKLAFPRERPFVRFPSQVNAILPESMNSYPSGHVTRLAGESYFIRKGLPSTLFLSLMIILLSLSRVAMGVHYFTDTLGGFLISYPLASLSDRAGVYDRLLAALHIMPKEEVEAKR